MDKFGSRKKNKYNIILQSFLSRKVSIEEVYFFPKSMNDFENSTEKVFIILKKDILCLYKQ
jgi:hypothetical protein